MRPLRPILPWLLLLALSVPVIFVLYPRTAPLGGLRTAYDDRTIVERSRQILTVLNIDPSSRTASVSFLQNEDLLRQLQQTFGFGRTNGLLQDTLPVYSWQVRWSTERPSDIRVSARSSDAGLQQIADLLRGNLTLEFDMLGRLLSFDRKIADSVDLPTCSPSEARALALAFLRSHTHLPSAIIDSVPLVPEKTINQPRRKDYQFASDSRFPVVADPVHVSITIAGNVLARFDARPEIPAKYTRDDSERVVSIIVLLLYIAAGILMVVTAVRRLRSFEIGFRMAAVVGILMALVFDLELYLSMRQELGWEAIVALVVPPVFIAGGMLLVWAAAESIGREVWREKFVSLDLLTRGHILHSRVGVNVVRGSALGAGAFAVWLLALRALDALGPLGVSLTGQEEFHLFTVAIPSLYVFSHGFYATAFEYAFVVVFVVSFLRRYIPSTTLLIAVSSVIMALFRIGHVVPLPVSFLLQMLVSVLFVWSFTRYDGLTVLVGLMAFAGLQDLGALLVSGHPHYVAAGFVVGACALVLLLGGIATQFRRREITDFEAITPAFVRHISERQRLQHELEIARSVQMSFLPKRNPVRYRLDIASRCAPALEVGGDYYDFITISDTKLGVAVGDVSGKGTQAAFFMTLTKGFLNALAKVSESPAAVLTQVNRLFYENVERGMFISMVYGIFDTAGQTLTLARAGHNPVIMRKSQAKDVQSVNPMGIALGLDPGETFARSIREVTIPFEQGDFFVFYTDGFPEAMNKKREEFGEQRLAQVVERFAGGTAMAMMEGIFREMKAFTGNAKQHDDMTIVVVKIQ